jgi:methylthioribose-1-phosphate isomerase
MNVNGKHYKTIWVKETDKKVIQIIDQTRLPHEFIINDLKSVKDVTVSIKEMLVRGAGLIGAAAGYGMYFAALEAPENDFDSYVTSAGTTLKAARPTAVNLAWAVKRQLNAIKKGNTPEEKIKIAFKTANDIAEEDAEYCRMIGEHGLKIIEEISKKKNGEPVNILTHCNAGWLAFVDYGSATAPVYAAHNAGIKVHVWVDETRPRNQGAKLTAWELLNHGVPHHVIADNAGGHLMQQGMVDMCIVGSDRTTCTGDVANKIGTYLKALAAKANNVPFYVALPSSTFDWKMKDGVKEIPIEERSSEEVTHIDGLSDGKVKRVLVAPKGSPAMNFGFDVTPAKYITGLITERGITKANERDILDLYPEHKDKMYEGYIKFKCIWRKSEPVSEAKLNDLNKWRIKLFSLGLIGACDDGIGFGNISVRDVHNKFIITGSATGNLNTLTPEHYVLVDAYNLKENSLVCTGPIKASSESLSHAAIYESSENTNAVIHVHDLTLWKRLIDKVPTTKRNVLYGTPEMANEIKRLFKETNVSDEKIIVMAGHEEGIISFGNDLNEAGEILLTKMHEFM